MADRRRQVLVAATLALAAVAPVPAAAERDVSAPQLQSLAAQARRDPQVLGRLREVRTVDGRPVDVDAGLAGAQGSDLDARLATLAAAPPSTSPADPAGARGRARSILASRQFHPRRVPRPLHGVLRTLGGWLRTVTGPIGRLWSRIAAHPAAVAALGAVVIALAAAATLTLGRRRAAFAGKQRQDGARGRAPRPGDIERAADAAAHAGDFATAVRLRFRAGVLRLAERGAIPDRASLTTGDLRRRIRSRPFDDVAAAFDEIAYGGRPAAAVDDEQARAGWHRVLEDTHR